MAWKETDILNERKEFITEALKGQIPFIVLCQKYGISEKTGYKWKNRFMQDGYNGLYDQSKAPITNPDSLDEDVVIRIIKLRQAHPAWGAKKLAILYAKAYKDGSKPSISSIQRIISKAGLVKKRRVRPVKPDSHRLRQYIKPEAPNDVWTVDFKGWWVSNREKCLPLTIRDAYSRFIIDIRLMQSQSAEAVRAVLTAAFKKYGLPKVIRSDNGTPFAAPNSLLNLTCLSVWWISLGILPDRIDPGKPTQNGSHERMHADMSRELQGKTAGGIAANQAAIDAWRKEYNEVRPNEALGMKTPCEVFSPSSSTKYEGDVEQLEYPLGFLTRRVFCNGQIILNGRRISVGFALRNFHIGLLPKDDFTLTIWIADFPLGEIDLNTYCFRPLEHLECL